MAFVNTVGDEELLERAQKALRPHGVHLGWAPDADEVLVSIDDAQTRLPATVSRVSPSSPDAYPKDHSS